MPTLLHDLTGDRTLLVLAAAPGDESLFCGGLIAEACARGRPPLVAVLTDGASLGAPGVSADARAAAHARETRAAVRILGLPPGRLLMLGVRDDAVPEDGAFFEQIVDAIGFLTWMRDLNVICGPRAESAELIHARVSKIAATIAQRSGIGWLRYGASSAACIEAFRQHDAARRRAIDAHVSVCSAAVEPIVDWYEQGGYELPWRSASGR